VPQLALEGDPAVPLEDALVLDDAADVERLRAEHEQGTPIVVRASDAQGVVRALARPEVAAVVVPTVSSLGGDLATRVAAAVLESRLGAGSRRSLYLPGNVRQVVDHPGETIVLRRSDYLALGEAGVPEEQRVTWLADRGRRTIYTPDTFVSAPPPPIVRPHLESTFRHGRERGAAARRSRGASLSGATAVSVAPVAAATGGVVLIVVAGKARSVGLALVLAYGAALLASGAHAAARFRSPTVGLLQPLAVVATQATYLAGFLRGLSERPRPRRRPGRDRRPRPPPLRASDPSL
jgi:hypothetical protein